MVVGFSLPLISLLRTVRRLRRHSRTIRVYADLLRMRCRDSTAQTVEVSVPLLCPPAAGPMHPDLPLSDEEGLLDAVESLLNVWNVLMDSSYHTCNSRRFLDDFNRCARALGDERSLFVLLQYAVNRRCDGLVVRLRERHPTLTEYELDMLCMLRFGFSFNCIRLLHHHENVNSLYSRRTKIRRKLHLPRRYPLEDYLAELSGR